VALALRLADRGVQLVEVRRVRSGPPANRELGHRLPGVPELAPAELDPPEPDHLRSIPTRPGPRFPHRLDARKLGRVVDDLGLAARHDAAAPVVAVVDAVDLERDPGPAPACREGSPVPCAG
jgi:hypothetical protein